jgi:transposase-like protein
MKTAEGMVEFAAPQVRDTAEPFASAIRQNLAGRTGALEDLAVELYARGLSTRDIEDAFTDEAGRRLLSRAAVSEITERLWSEYEAFTRRDLGEHRIVYLFVDGIAERLRAGQAREPVLAAWGIGEDGRKVLLHLMAGSKEDTETVRAFFQDMRVRGLGDPLLVVSDGAPGIIRAIEECFPRSARQRCLAHRMRNLAVKVPTDLWPEFKARASACYQAPSRAIARELAKGMRTDYGAVLPSAVACFEDDFEACIAHLRLPVTHRRSTRTTNLLERLFVEERRRLKIIPNGFGEKPVLKLMFGALVRAAERWRGLRFTEFELRQIAAVRKDLDAEYEAAITRSDRPSHTRVSSRSAP